MTNQKVLYAIEDNSVNFITPTDNGFFEARYVRRSDDYFIAYVSSQSGCDRACRFCHLTATRQTSMTQADTMSLVEQIHSVLKHHQQQAVQPTRMNVNFMARGEPFLNPILQNRTKWSELRYRVQRMVARYGVDDVRWNISTIMPQDVLEKRLASLIAGNRTTIYYSLYSMRESFRKRWLPKAANPVDALRHLANWQQETGGSVALHWAFIEGENDDLETLKEIVAAVKASGLKPKFNTVRYNPFSERQGREPCEEIVQRNFQFLAEALGDTESRIVPRVGLSVKASCGMFIEGNRAYEAILEKQDNGRPI